MDGGSFAVQHVRSYGAGFGLRLIQSRALTLSFGLGAKYYRGTGYYEVDVENQTAFAAFNRGFGTELVAEGATLGSALRPSGFGVALDLAVRAEIAGLWFASLAINAFSDGFEGRFGGRVRQEVKCILLKGTAASYSLHHSLGT